MTDNNKKALKPYRIGLPCGYGPLWVDEYVLATSEPEALAKYKKLTGTTADEAVCLVEWFSWLKDWNDVKHKIKDINGVFSWPR